MKDEEVKVGMRVILDPPNEILRYWGPRTKQFVKDKTVLTISQRDMSFNHIRYNIEEKRRSAFRPRWLIKVGDSEMQKLKKRLLG